MAKEALSSQWKAVGNGANITEPDLTIVSTRISLGKRVWIDDNGSIMSDD